MLTIRGPSGLGDAIYLRPIAERFAEREPVTVASDFPDVFTGSPVKVVPFRRDNIQVVAHYVAGKKNTLTTQYQDMVDRAGLDHVPLRFDWNVTNPGLIAKLRELANGRPLVLAHGGREPFNRRDKFGIDLMPTHESFDTVLKALDDCFIVGIGKHDALYELPVDIDLNGQTTVADILDLGKCCDGIVGQCSFAVPLAEVFDRPLLVVWSEKSFDSREEYVRLVTPAKIISKSTSRHVLDGLQHSELIEAAHAFRRIL